MPFKPGQHRAEKDTATGNSFYRCSWEGCTKKFGSAGHVRRHEKIHVGRTPYACAYCQKSFGRSDVRAKHVVTMHRDVMDADGEQPMKLRKLSDDSTTSTSRTLSISTSVNELSSGSAPGFAPVINDSGPGETSPVSSILWASRSCESDLSMSLFEPHHRVSSGTTGTRNSISNTSALAPFVSNAVAGTGCIDPSSLSVKSSDTDQPILGLPLSLPRQDIADQLPTKMHTNSTSEGPAPAPTDLIAFDPGWEWFGQLFGWGTDQNVDQDIGLQNTMFEKNGVGPGSSTDTLSAAWLLCSTPRAGSPVAAEKENEKESSHKRVVGMIDPFGRKDDNPWPNAFRPSVPDRPLTLGSVKITPSSHPPRHIPPSISQASRNAMLSLIHLSHQAHWLIPDIDDFPDHEILSDFADIYFEKFHPLFPIIHRPTFEKSETPAVLMLAVASIGATLADPKFRSLAVALCELVRRMITWMRGSDQRAKFDRPTLVAFTLQTALGIACGSREMFFHAEIFRCSLVTTCRRLHLLRGLDTSTDDLYKRDSNPSVEERYRAFLMDEERRRLGWGVYLLDAQMAAMLNTPPIFAVKEAGIHPPTDEVLWEAPNAQAWAAAIERGAAPDPRIKRPKFLKVLNMWLAGQEGQVKVSDFTVGIITWTLWRMLMDQHLLQRALGLGLSDNGMELASYTIRSHILETKPSHLLTRLAASTFPVHRPSFLRLSPAILYHHAHLVFTRPGLLQRIKHVSGKYEPDMTHDGSLLWLRTWLTDGKEVRKILWHAGVLSSLLTEFPSNSLGELFWTFDCALCFWIILKYASHQITSSTFRASLHAANWFDVHPPSMWIAHGGPIIFPLLGSSTSWTVKMVLRFFMDRLEKIPWGLAVQYRLVLNRLLEREEDGEDSESLS